MLVVRTSLAPSRIHGLGVVEAEPIRSGDPVWRFAPGLDLVIPLGTLADRPAAFRAYLDTYAYRSPEFPGSLVLSCDHAKFLNHAEDSNTDSRGQVTLARLDIAVGEEITCDYRACVLDWPGFG